MKKNKTYEKKYINKFKHILLNNKKEKGSIALYVIVSLVFLSIVLISMLAASKNSAITSLKAQGAIKNVYENDVASTDDIYSSVTTKIHEIPKWEIEEVPENDVYTDNSFTVKIKGSNQLSKIKTCTLEASNITYQLDGVTIAPTNVTLDKETENNNEIVYKLTLKFSQPGNLNIYINYGTLTNEYDNTNIYTKLETGIEIQEKWLTEYTRLAYVESNGTSNYIDTGFVPNQDTKVELVFQVASSTNGVGQNIFGARKGNKVDSYAFGISSNTTDPKWSWVSQFYTNNKQNFATYDTDKHLVIQDKNKFILYNNASIDSGYKIEPWEHSTGSFTCPGNMYLFNMNINGTSATTTVPIKIFSCKIYDNGTLVRNFIPCRTKTVVIDVEGNTCPKDTIGLYDTVNNDFYSPKGGTLTAGNDILPFEEAYQEVEYIETAGGLYIDTGIIPTSKTGVWVKFSQSIFGAQKVSGCVNTSGSSWTNRFYLPYFGGTNNNMYYGYNGYYTISDVQGVSNQIYEGKLNYNNNRSLIINGTVKASLTTCTFNNNGTITLFATHTSSGISQYHDGCKIYFCRITEENSLIRDFIPCRTKTVVTDAEGNSCTAGTVGLYDTVNNDFYSPKGGTLTAGSDVN